MTGHPTPQRLDGTSKSARLPCASVQTNRWCDPYDVATSGQRASDSWRDGMRRFRQSPALRPIAQGEGRNADLFLADLQGSAVQSDAPSLSNDVPSFEDLLFSAGRPSRSGPDRPAGESFPEAWAEEPPTALPVSERKDVPTRSPARLARVSAKVETLQRHLSS